MSARQISTGFIAFEQDMLCEIAYCHFLSEQGEKQETVRLDMWVNEIVEMDNAQSVVFIGELEEGGKHYSLAYVYDRDTQRTQHLFKGKDQGGGFSCIDSRGRICLLTRQECLIFDQGKTDEGERIWSLVKRMAFPTFLWQGCIRLSEDRVLLIGTEPVTDTRRSRLVIASIGIDEQGIRFSREAPTLSDILDNSLYFIKQQSETFIVSIERGLVISFNPKEGTLVTHRFKRGYRAQLCHCWIEKGVVSCLSTDHVKITRIIFDLNQRTTQSFPMRLHPGYSLGDYLGFSRFCCLRSPSNTVDIFDLETDRLIPTDVRMWACLERVTP